ncbi:hypothetical protein D3C77_442660 [compost metagenome]
MSFLVQAVHHHLVTRLDFTRGFAGLPGRASLLSLRLRFLQLFPGSNQLVLFNRCPFFQRQLAEIFNNPLRFAARFGNDGNRFILRLLNAFVALIRQFVQFGLMPFPQLLQLFPQPLCGLPLLLRAKPILFQGSDHMLYAQIFFLYFPPGKIENLCRQPKPFGDSKRVASARHAHEQTISGA